MGLFIIAGLLIVFGILFWVLEENYCENWMLAAKLHSAPVERKLTLR